MTKSPPEIRLALDSRPIPLDQLTTDLRNTIEALLDTLKAIGDHNNARSQHKPAHDLPWASVDENRTHRVLMIDGERGSGKTSLLLTLLQNWDPRHTTSDKGRLLDEVPIRALRRPPHILNLSRRRICLHMGRADRRRLSLPRLCPAVDERGRGGACQ